MGIESHILSPAEAKKLYPLMNTDDIVGALYSPSDGHIDPAGYCTALARGAKMNGAQVKNLLTKLLCPITNNCNGCEKIIVHQDVKIGTNYRDLKHKPCDLHV